MILKQKLNLNTAEDWNSVTTRQIKKLGGSGLLKIYNLYQIKCLACPEGKEIFSLPAKPSGYWNNNDNVVKFLDILKEKLNFKLN